MKKILILIMIFFIHFVYAMQINEVMWNPAGIDNNKEFVEIFSNEKTNISGYIISDGDSNDTLRLLNYSESQYSVIVENNYELNLPNASIYSAGAAIGNGLSNNDLITLYDLNGTIVDSFLINASLGGNNNGHSLHYFNKSWSESFNINGSPGASNFKANKTNSSINFILNFSKNINLTNVSLLNQLINETTDVFINKSNSTLNKISVNSNLINNSINNIFVNKTNTAVNSIDLSNENITNYFINETNLSLIKHNSTITNNKTNLTDSFADETNSNFVETSLTTKNISLSNKPCNISFKIRTEKTIFNVNETIKFGFELSNNSVLPETEYNIEYWIEDFFGKIIKKKYETINLNKKQFTPKIKNSINALLIKADLYACNKTFHDEKTIIIKNKKNNNSSIEIKKIYLKNNKTKFGDILKVKLGIYKGNSSKNQLKIWIEGNERVSKVTYADLNSKHTLYDLILPVQLKTNCNNKYNSGNYRLIVEGFGINSSTELYIEKTSLSCKKIVVKQKTNKNKKTSKSKTEFKVNKGIFYFVEHKKEVKVGEELFTEVKIINNDYFEHKFEAWSYIYKGPKSYSGVRESNLKKIILPSNSSETIKLRNIVTNASTGEYKLKIKIKKDNRKTSKEFTRKIIVKNPKQKKDIVKIEKTQNKRVTEVKKLPMNESLQKVSLKNNSLKTNTYEYESSNHKLRTLTRWVMPPLIIFIAFLFWIKL